MDIYRSFLPSKQRNCEDIYDVHLQTGPVTVQSQGLTRNASTEEFLCPG